MLAIADADSAEHATSSANLVIVPVACAVPNRAPDAPKLSGAAAVGLLEGSRLAQICGTNILHEEFFCNYEVNPQFRNRMEPAGLKVSALGPHNEVRAVELPRHAFFIATLFQPQLTSEATSTPHPVILAYLKSAAAQRGESASAD